MRHQKAGRKFGRNTSHRRAMFRNLAGNLVLHERIETTDAKAKELRRIAERLITKVLRLGDNLMVDVSKIKDEEERARIVAQRLHARRQLSRFLPKRLTKQNPDGTFEEVDLIHKLFVDIAPRYIKRVKEQKGGGYTRIIKLNRRCGDNASMALIELIGFEGKPVKSVVSTENKEAEEDISEG